MKKFEKFMRSRNGMLSLFGSLVILLLIVAYFSGALGRITGTAGLPYPMPPNGYTCLPTCVEKDGKMFVLVGANQNNMSNTGIKVWIMVPGDQPTLKLGIFDGDAGKGVDNTIALNARKEIKYTNGNWDDSGVGDTTYTLYADPLADGSGKTVLGSWKGNDVMLNNAWWETSINNDGQARAANEHYYYRLEAVRDSVNKGAQAFKVRADGYLMTGLRLEWPVGLMGGFATPNDMTIVQYNGDWQLNFKIPSDVQKLEIWDGDFNYKSDPDDPNTVGKPAWSTNVAVDEGVNLDSSLQDDSAQSLYQISPEVYYEVLDPGGKSIYVNNNPSGAKEWENTIISIDPADNPDLLISETLKAVPEAGMYSIHIVGLDHHNFIWFSVGFPICDTPVNGGCPPMPNEQ